MLVSSYFRSFYPLNIFLSHEKRDGKKILMLKKGRFYQLENRVLIQNLANTYIHYMGHKSGDLNCPVLWLEFLMSPFVYVRWDIFFYRIPKGRTMVAHQLDWGLLTFDL